MALRFELDGLYDIASANWIASLIEPGPSIPVIPFQQKESRVLFSFLTQLRSNFQSSSPQIEQEFQNTIESWLERLGAGCEFDLKELVSQLRRYFAGRRWTALLLPSGNSFDIDHYIGSKKFVRTLLNLAQGVPTGLILHLDARGASLSKNRSLVNVLPAFRTALANATNWPGVLIWTPRGDSVFLPLLNETVDEVERSACSLFADLYRPGEVSLKELCRAYFEKFPSLLDMVDATLHIVQLSDLHIGSSEADLTIPRVQQLMRNIVHELGDPSRIIVVISGDLMDDPRDRYLDGVRGFMGYLETLGSKQIIAVPGNHDVRRHGWLNPNYQVVAAGVPHVISSGTVWIDESRVGFACFNSVVGGHVARGIIGDRQLLNLAISLDQQPLCRDFSLIAVLHHHPTPVQPPEGYIRPFYERILGYRFEETECLKDADKFLNFVESRNMTAILHGHKHIPRIAETPRTKIPIFGCGSSVGKVQTRDNCPCLSINVISLNTRRGQLSGRLLAEKLGGGPVEQQYHEVLCRRAL